MGTYGLATFTKRITDIVAKIDQGIIITETELERNLLNIVEEELKRLGLTPVIEQQRRIVRGRSDARIGGLFFEFKRPGRPLEELLESKRQVDEYIDEYKRVGVLLRGVLTDGRHGVFVDEDKQIVERGKLEDSVWMLEAWVSALAMRVASPTDLRNYLGPASSVGKAFIKELFEAYGSHRNDTFIRESYDMWDGVYGCATNLDEDAIKAVKTFAKNSLDILLQTKDDVKAFLFVIETYLSILMKILVAEVAIQRSIIPSASLEEMLGEDVLVGYGKLSERIPFLSRVFEYDTFFWFVDLANVYPQLGRILTRYLTDVIKVLALMDFTGVSTDLVKQMYQGFFDAATRKALGEFYTPDILVDQVLDTIAYIDKTPLTALILDPACGSGTFLVRAIDRFMSASNGEMISKSDALMKITNQIIGVDIHPFAVAMAKVNYLLAIGRLIDPTVRRVVKSLPIPIYWADSLARTAAKSQFEGASAVRTVEIRVPVLGTFILPDPDDIDWDRIIDSALAAVDNEWSDDRFLASFPRDKSLVYQDILLKFLKVFRDRKEGGLNGRWLSTLRNFIVIDKMRRRCDFVVGNPPWVRIHNINKDIQKELMGKFEVYKKDKKSGKVVGWKPKLVATRIPFPQQIDYCMAFVEAGLGYLKEGGKLGFVITAKIMNALYANLLRRFLIEKTRILRLIDYSLSNKQFFEEATNYPLILALENCPPRSDIDITMEAATRLEWKTNQMNLPLILGDIESPWSIAPPYIIRLFRTMQRGNPRLGDGYPIRMGVKTSANDIYLVTDFIPTATRGVVTVTNGKREKKNLEEGLLRPVIRGEDIGAWNYKVSGYIIWTHDDAGKVRSKLPPNASKYFSSYESDLLKRDDYKKGQPIWVIFRVSEEKLKTKVAWGELSRTMETVIVPEFFNDERLGKKKLIAIQTVYFVAADNADLSYAFSALFNSTPVRAFITSFAERARGRYFRHISWTVGLIPLPIAMVEEGIKDPGIQDIIRLSKKMHECKGEGVALADELDKAVARLYGLSDEEVTELRIFLLSCGAPTLNVS
ncbi:MAG: N-6 DNA methylase [archaeon]|nr:N-6 DNA methylase [archaeon]